jgi:hypothetical protein
VPEQVGDLAQAGATVEQRGGQRMPQQVRPRIGASIPARRSAVSTARPTMSLLIGAPTRCRCNTNTCRAAVFGRACCR